MKNPFRPVDVWDKNANSKYMKLFSDFCFLYGIEKLHDKAHITNLTDYIKSGSELIESYIDKSAEVKEGTNFYYYFIAKIENGTYLAFYAKNFRGKKLEKAMQKLLTLVDIMRNNYVKQAMSYMILVSDL